MEPPTSGTVLGDVPPAWVRPSLDPIWPSCLLHTCLKELLFHKKEKTSKSGADALKPSFRSHPECCIGALYT
eukprot:11489052-Karenia_brevis.AAC.1